jgi:hypothetical protein
MQTDNERNVETIYCRGKYEAKHTAEARVDALHDAIDEQQRRERLWRDLALGAGLTFPCMCDGVGASLEYALTSMPLLWLGIRTTGRLVVTRWAFKEAARIDRKYPPLEGE